MIHRSASFAAALMLVACGGDGPPAADQEPSDSSPPPESTPAQSVSIVAPMDGAVLETGAVQVRLEVDGLTITTAGDLTENTGHHHLLLNVDLADPSLPVPTTPGYLHKGDGSTEHTYESLEPGEYRLIAVVGDGLHVPLMPLVTDTVHFSVVDPDR